MKTLLIAAGGTGGHITPGISVAEAWLKNGGKIVLATLIRNIEYPDIRRLAAYPRVSIVAYDAPRLIKNPLAWPSFFTRFFSAYRLVKRAANAESVSAILGMGGYSSFPAVFYAITSRTPLFLCEQNARWGVVTRTCRFFARGIFLAFEAKKRLPEKYKVTGNPLREMFGTTRPKTRDRMHKRRRRKATILFLGGSQGANDINALYSQFIGKGAAKKFQCVVAAGREAAADLAKTARRGDQILPFITDMPAAYGDADFIVARCGSGTLFEILWSGKPAFLIPYPFAAADHQRANAEAIRLRTPCRVYDERPFSATNAVKAFEEFLLHPPHRVAGPTQERIKETAAERRIVRYIKEAI